MPRNHISCQLGGIKTPETSYCCFSLSAYKKKSPFFVFPLVMVHINRHPDKKKKKKKKKIGG
jgi:hypothetical protein